MLAGLLWLAIGGGAGDATELAAALREIDPRVIDAGGRLTDQERERLRSMLYDDGRVRLREANRRSTANWRALGSRADWERFAAERIERLERSLGAYPHPPMEPTVHVTRTLAGDGYRIENIVFESRPDVLVTANFYRPAAPAAPMPGILICTSHHNAKTQGELQDMGIMWARRGCLVLVIDNPGYGERREHPFDSADDYPGPFRVGRQDYYFRYNLGIQLQLIGDGLIGWIVWDLRRGVDVLLAQPGVDPARIVLLGSVAGGGDPAAVAAALDRRITCAVPFNFGGPEPENRYPLPEDAEDSFNYAGSGSWETTRNLRLSARDGFLPWVIVGGIAPRHLIYAHEFSWDRERDPVWRRLNSIYKWHDAADRLDYTLGFGRVTLRPPEASHCSNIGPVQRRRIHAAFARWFEIETPNEDEESRDRRDSSKLSALPGSDLDLTPLHRVAARLGRLRSAEFVEQAVAADSPRQRLSDAWRKLLGDVDPVEPLHVDERPAEPHAAFRVERFVIHGNRWIRLPVVLLVPSGSEQPPVVIGLAQGGKAKFLEERARVIARLLESDVAVCLPDLRGTGETRPGNDRGRRSWSTSLASTEQLLGQTLAGLRLQDLRTLMAALSERDDVDAGRLALWGDSFAPANSAGDELAAPLDAQDLPGGSEPLGHLLALLGGLFESRVRAVASFRGGLVSFGSVLESPFCYLPYDAVIPGAIAAGDLDSLTALANRPLWISGLVDGHNVPLDAAALRTALPRTSATQADALRSDVDSDPDTFADWLASSLEVER